MTLWTKTQELQVQLRDGRSFVRGQLVLLEEQDAAGEEGGAALVFGNADHVPLDEVQRFLACIASRESPGGSADGEGCTARIARQREVATQTPHDGPSPLFADELLRCAAEPARCTSTTHIMQTVRQLGLLHERRLELQGRQAPADRACRPHDDAA